MKRSSLFSPLRSVERSYLEDPKFFDKKTGLPKKNRNSHVVSMSAFDSATNPGIVPRRNSDYRKIK
jgi:hypothetical protein